MKRISPLMIALMEPTAYHAKKGTTPTISSTSSIHLVASARATALPGSMLPVLHRRSQQRRGAGKSDRRYVSKLQVHYKKQIHISEYQPHNVDVIPVMEAQSSDPYCFLGPD